MPRAAECCACHYWSVERGGQKRQLSQRNLNTGPPNFYLHHIADALGDVAQSACVSRLAPGGQAVPITLVKSLLQFERVIAPISTSLSHLFARFLLTPFITQFLIQ